MGWDVWGDIDTGGDGLTRVTESFGYTHNCNPMLRAVGIDWREMHGKPLAEVWPVVAQGAIALRSDTAKFRAMNPPNGWGSYDTLLPVLDRIVDEFARHPKATLYACL